MRLARGLGLAAAAGAATALAGRIAASEPSRATLPHAIVPIYVRKSDAELARDRAAHR